MMSESSVFGAKTQGAEEDEPAKEPALRVESLSRQIAEELGIDPDHLERLRSVARNVAVAPVTEGVAMDGEGGDDLLPLRLEPASGDMVAVDDAAAVTAGEIFGRLDAVSKPEEALQLLEDAEVLDALVGATAAALDVAKAKFKAKGITGKSVDDALDRHRARTHATAAKEETERLVLDPKVRAEAEQLLSAPDLLDRFLASVKEQGLVGEEDSAITILLAGVTRRTRRVHLAVKGDSSGGKSHLMETVVTHFPQDDVLRITSMSTKALLYMQEGLDGKIILLLEQNAGEAAQAILRMAMSDGSVSNLAAQKNDDGIATQYTTTKVGCIFSTTTMAKLHDENETRFLEITVDDSEAMTAKVMEAQADRRAKPLSQEERVRREANLKVWRAALAMLEVSEVTIPQAPLLKDRFNAKRVRSRRDFHRLLDLIEASALLHQRQRARDRGRIVAAQSDVDLACRLTGAQQGKKGGAGPRLRQLHQSYRQVYPVGREFGATDLATRLHRDPDATRRNLHDLRRAGLAEQVDQSSGKQAAKWRLLPLPDSEPEDDRTLGEQVSSDPSDLPDFYPTDPPKPDKIAAPLGEERCPTVRPGDESKSETGSPNVAAEEAAKVFGPEVPPPSPWGGRKGW